MKSIYYDPNLQEGEENRKWFENVKLIGEIDEGTSIYIEDYAYTYLHQYASKELSRELSGVLIGQYFEGFDQVEIYGVIPIKKELLSPDAKWIDKNVLDIIDEERQKYFPEGRYVGWMHTQPGYGIMSTTQEVNVHKALFGKLGVLMLIDPLYKTEAFFTYKQDSLRRKKGFCINYEKNELMQKYMEEHPLVEKKDEKGNDKVVDDFRELGAKRKKEVEKKMKKEKIAMALVGGLLLVGMFITSMYTQRKKVNDLEGFVVSTSTEYSDIEDKVLDNPVEVIFTSTQKEVDPTYNIHTVEIGDSLLSISFDYYETEAMIDEIAKLNYIVDYDAIFIGQKLKLPKR